MAINFIYVRYTCNSVGFGTEMATNENSRHTRAVALQRFRPKIVVKYLSCYRFSPTNECVV